MSEQPIPAPDVSASSSKPPIVVKKYANRRLYNTDSSSYITLETLAEMVRGGRDFVVYDAKSGDDITRSVLTQIIVEEEGKGGALLPIGFLRQLIGFYGDSLQNLVPRYLEQAMANFAHQQQEMRRTMQETMGNLFPFNVEEMGRQMERAMSLFTPFYRAPGVATPDEAAENGSHDDRVAALEREVANLREQLVRAREHGTERGGAAAEQGSVNAKHRA